MRESSCLATDWLQRPYPPNIPENTNAANAQRRANPHRMRPNTPHPLKPTAVRHPANANNAHVPERRPVRVQHPPQRRHVPQRERVQRRPGESQSGAAARNART